ncbi:13 kDa deflagellation-inducible protein [Durusdinium trenchii]|uniref:13 kDa deflagellation-inducible protein n=1 Tax=Durusdinium trenchii TaxID=1381693 RepID=A0ABP0I3M7_9DINO
MCLAEFPMRQGGTLEVNTKYHDLAQEQQRLLKQYLEHSFNNELDLLKSFDCLFEKHAGHLRVKEIFETVEVWKKVVSHLQRCNETRKSQNLEAVSRIYDIASGHGLLAVLLAYRFPQVQVVAVDREKRMGFDHYVEVVNEFGEAEPGTESCLANLSFVDVHTAENAAFVCVHGCNELNLDVLKRALQKRAVWLVVPCCIREGLSNISVRCAATREEGDDTRHALMCGMIAAQYQASAIASIDRRITNRHLVIEGDAAFVVSPDHSPQNEHVPSAKKRSRWRAEIYRVHLIIIDPPVHAWQAVLDGPGLLVSCIA